VPEMMVAAAGGTPTLGQPGHRSAATTWDAVTASRPDLMILAPCGYDLSAAFVRPGPRLVDGVQALAGICHPDVMPAHADLATRV